MNLYLIVEYRNNPNSIHSIIALFWIQNILIGIYNFIDIITAQNIKKGSYPVKESKGCSAVFFLFHYGAFQLAYLLFLGFHLDVKRLDWQYIQIAFWLLLAGMFISFILNRLSASHTEVNLSTMFYLPYLRIVPMHLMILLPSFLAVSSFTVFLVLKMVFDVLMHVITTGMMAKKDVGDA
jgi:ABC-type phosphate/phosphonate transport system permease subunit